MGWVTKRRPPPSNKLSDFQLLPAAFAFFHPCAHLFLSLRSHHLYCFQSVSGTVFWRINCFLHHEGFLSLWPFPFVGEAVMQLKEEYLDQVVGEVEDLSARVALLKGRFAQQKVSVKLEHYWELEYVRTSFAEFKRRIQDLEYADDAQLERLQVAVETAWKDLVHAVDTLLAALP